MSEYTQIQCETCGTQVGGEDSEEVAAVMAAHWDTHAANPPRNAAKAKAKGQK